MRINTKAKILESCTIPVLTYGAQMWAPTSKQIERLRVTVRAMERIMVGIKLKDKKNDLCRKECVRKADFEDEFE